MKCASRSLSRLSPSKFQSLVPQVRLEIMEVRAVPVKEELRVSPAIMGYLGSQVLPVAFLMYVASHFSLQIIRVRIDRVCGA